MQSDQLAKRLYGFLCAAECDSSLLRTLGWWDFLLKGVPDTNDPRRIAAAATHCLLVDHNGHQVNHDDRILYGILAFVQAECGGTAPSKCAANLTAVLMQPPVSLEGVERWFVETFQ